MPAYRWSDCAAGDFIIVDEKSIRRPRNRSRPVIKGFVQVSLRPKPVRKSRQCSEGMIHSELGVQLQDVRSDFILRESNEDVAFEESPPDPLRNRIPFPACSKKPRQSTGQSLESPSARGSTAALDNLHRDQFARRRQQRLVSVGDRAGEFR